MRKDTDSFHERQEGVILIEFALTISILMVLFMATITFSFLLKDYYSVHKVAREGAKEASVTHDINWARVKAGQAAALWGLDANRMQMSFSDGVNSVTCTVIYTADPLNKLFPGLVEKENLTQMHFRSSATYVHFGG